MSIVEYTIKKNSKSWPKIHCGKCDKFIRPVDVEELEKWPIHEICKECKDTRDQEANLVSSLRSVMRDFLRSAVESIEDDKNSIVMDVDEPIYHFIELMRAYESNK